MYVWMCMYLYTSSIYMIQQLITKLAHCTAQLFSPGLWNYNRCIFLLTLRYPHAHGLHKRLEDPLSCSFQK